LPHPEGKGADDAVASCPSFVDSPFRASLLQEDGMKRVSKRDIRFRFEMVDDAKVRIESIERGHAITRLEGVECHLEVLRTERRDLSNTGMIRAFVNSYPGRQGDGCPPRCTKPEKGESAGFLRGLHWRRPSLHSQGLDHDAVTCRYEQFMHDHPVGSLVEADVVACFRNKIRIILDGDLASKLVMGDYVDRWPYCRRMDLGSLHLSNRIEVIVRRVDPPRHVIAVSMHGYPRDAGYCNYSAGYRQAYDVQKGQFRLLPWDRERH
jgi:hypothetical protein